MWVTWKHNDTDLPWPLTFELKVDLFYEQALGWQLHIADLVANGGTAFGEDALQLNKIDLISAEIREALAASPAVLFNLRLSEILPRSVVDSGTLAWEDPG